MHKKAFIPTPSQKATPVKVRGFTFIELLIVIAIIGIMTGVMLVSTGSSRTDKALEAAAREAAATIREAQNYALTGKDAGAGCNIYTFDYGNTGNDEYSVSNTCNINDNYTLKNGVVFQPPSGSFNFSAPHGVSSLGAAEAIVLTKNSKTIRVCVYPSGKIEETNIGAAACP